MNLSPVGVVGPVWGCRGKKVNSRGFLEWYPRCGLTRVPATCWGRPPPLCWGRTLEGAAPAFRLQAAWRRAGPGSQDSRFSPLRPLPGSARTSLCLGFLICPVSLSGGADGLTPRVSGRGLPSGAGQGKRDGPWLSWSSVQTRGLVWTWAPSAHRPALCLHSPSSSRGPPGDLTVSTGEK